MDSFDTKIAYFKNLMNRPKQPLVEQNVNSKEIVGEIEDGCIELNSLSIAFERKDFFDFMSLLFPKEFFKCVIDANDMKFFACNNHGFYISIKYYTEFQENYLEILKLQYTDKMSMSKQKTVWTEEKSITTMQGFKIKCLHAEHAMPCQKVHNLIALCETPFGLISCIFSIYNKDFLLWIELCFAILKTTIVRCEYE